ncbi:MAG: hypothetical protein QW600_00695 [Candidatus Bathyarchaeia archaeon]|nr:hypothetical protein [Candidatus Bathyarchaeota archaeon]
MGCLLGKIQVEIRASFGKLVFEGSTAEEVLDTLASLPEDFLRKLETVVSDKISSNKDRTLDNIVKLTEIGPVLILRDSRALTHYEAVGLILYFSENKGNRPSQIRQLLEYSGMVNIQVSSRLNEMAKRGLVYKPTSGRPEWVLSPKGERWIRDEVLPKLRGSS